MVSSTQQAPDRGARQGDPPGVLLGLLAGSRVVLLFLVAVASQAPHNEFNRRHNATLSIPVQGQAPPVGPAVSAHVESPLVAALARWDGLWFVRIAEHGYATRFPGEDPTVEHPEPPSTGFFPLYPLAIRVLGKVVVSPLRAGLMLSNACLLGCIAVLFRLAQRWTDRRTAVLSSALLVLFPGSAFLSLPYSEALSLLLVLLACEAAADGRGVASGAWGLLAALARPTGVFVFVVLAERAWAARTDGRQLAPRVVAAMMPLAGFGAFLLFCHVEFGDALAPMHRQQWWRGTWTWPPRLLADAFQPDMTAWGTMVNAVDFLAAWMCLLLCVAAFRVVPLPVAALGLASAMLPFSVGTSSGVRMTMACFPAFIAAAHLLRRRPAWAAGVLTGCALMLAFYVVEYVRWSWVG